MTDNKPQKRIRINVATSVRGVKTYNATMELVREDLGTPAMLQDILAESDRLVAALDARYPKQEA